MPVWAFADKRPQVSSSAIIHPTAQLIGDVVIGERVSIWPGAVLRADFGQIEIGNGSCVQDNCVLHPGSEHATTIGEDCVVGHLVHLKGVAIEAAVLVGSGSILLMGCRVSTGAMVAAGALLTKATEVPCGFRAQGVPARLVADEIDVEFVRCRARRYYKLAETHQRSFGEGS